MGVVGWWQFGFPRASVCSLQAFDKGLHDDAEKLLLRANKPEQLARRRGKFTKRCRCFWNLPNGAIIFGVYETVPLFLIPWTHQPPSFSHLLVMFKGISICFNIDYMKWGQIVIDESLWIHHRAS